MGNASGHPTELELLILNVLWDEAPRTASEIRGALEDRGRSLAHTSVITTLQKMVDKQQLEQLSPTKGKALRFMPKVSHDAVSSGMLGDLVDRVFNGSAEAMMLSLFEQSDLDDESIRRMRRLLNQRLKEQKK